MARNKVQARGLSGPSCKSHMQSLLLKAEHQNFEASEMGFADVNKDLVLPTDSLNIDIKVQLTHP